MKRYRGGDGDSGIAAYACGPGWIEVRFRRGGTYRYDARHPGLAHVLEMQRLAEAGDGLNTYINRFVRGDYAARLEDGARGRRRNPT
ncbi:hypothetical protein [Pseudoxanthomonas taiwanensis]|jgi:hypothetical protein|uniref:KTSC domain-containing protein n=1 Tax=Pseudoxanthomonas taiwanensis TaxID=176598 RepID=A0A921P1K7_9GAMM|nr:hypothetical protein [Pseudoxanthomonas taiwanensis]KAF1688616.1 hypothetical protein CR938_09135 [Pseudoxanthomonas taiwanensis]MBO2468845.1 hypothetical protein [Xanthomonadaceae bacterium]